MKNKMVKVKICGLSRTEDIEAVNCYEADYAGFVFFEKSKRNVSYGQAEKLLEQLKKNHQIQSVAVCVSPDVAEVRRLRDMGFDLIQIHGTIPTDCLSDGGLALWQAVNIAGKIEETAAKEQLLQASNIRGYVADAAEYGSGRTFGWENGQSVCDLAFRKDIKAQNRQFVLAGGLNAENVQEGIRIFQPDVVDVSSGVERTGVKDAALIREFIRKVRES